MCLVFCNFCYKITRRQVSRAIVPLKTLWTPLLTWQHKGCACPLSPRGTWRGSRMRPSGCPRWRSCPSAPRWSCPASCPTKIKKSPFKRKHKLKNTYWNLPRKGIVRRDEYSFEGSNNQTNTFLISADVFHNFGFLFVKKIPLLLWIHLLIVTTFLVILFRGLVLAFW